jgi:O-phospho-L-seryl-tRNASec:L-selenocysteinyl-tRNA synthase
MVVQSLQLAGDSEAKMAMVVPVATGMALFLCLAALRKQRPGADCVVWCRCDQNSAVKAVALAGLRLEVVQCRAKEEALETDMEALAARVSSLGAERVCCVLTTTSCFAPRVPDKAVCLFFSETFFLFFISFESGGRGGADVQRIADPSFGEQRVRSAVGEHYDESCQSAAGGAGGRVRAVAGQELDGAGGRRRHLRQSVRAGQQFVNKTKQKERITFLTFGFKNNRYAGRASSGPIVDLFVTLLSLGVAGWKVKNTHKKRPLIFV